VVFGREITRDAVRLRHHLTDAAPSLRKQIGFLGWQFYEYEPRELSDWSIGKNHLAAVRVLAAIVPARLLGGRR
jgi:hypothetical protein